MKYISNKEGFYKKTFTSFFQINEFYVTL